MRPRASAAPALGHVLEPAARREYNVLAFVDWYLQRIGEGRQVTLPAR